MPYTRKQINRILTHKGNEVIDTAANVSLSQRVSESFTRRRLYALEDTTVIALYARFKAAFSDLRLYALQNAAQHGISALNSDYDTLRWKREFADYAVNRVNRLAQECAEYAAQQSLHMYLFGYYARAWSLDMQVAPDVGVQAPTPSAAVVTQRVLQPTLTEAYNPDEVLWDLLGVEWREEFASGLNTFVDKMRGSLTASIAQNLGIPQATKRLGDLLGITDGTSGAFGKINSLTRTYMMAASNTGALDLYMRNRDIVSGYTWLASKDGRVCTTCLRLNGQSWAFDDPARMMPPYDSHPSCRCSILPQMLPAAEVWPFDEPPRQTWNEWALSAGLGWLLGQLMGGSKTDSSQVGELDYEWDLEDRVDA
jgi:SPP1 gp7 family putative phage head morphogenesis protein